jgi:ketosteroid isomerase-like protein
MFNNQRVSDRDDFLAWVNSGLRDAEIALHDGDADPRREIWSREEPVTVLGAWKSATGRAELDELFTALEQTFSGCASYRFEVVAAEVSGDMAYTVGHEHTQAVINGEQRTYTLRATQIYRREAGEWKVIHRHGSELPEEVAFGDRAVAGLDQLYPDDA